MRIPKANFYLYTPKMYLWIDFGPWSNIHDWSFYKQKNEDEIMQDANCKQPSPVSKINRYVSMFSD